MKFKLLIVIISFLFIGLSFGNDIKSYFNSTDKMTEVRRGCCSHHGGVDCSKGKDRDGSVICSDGWKRSKCRYDEHCR